MAKTSTKTSPTADAPPPRASRPVVANRAKEAAGRTPPKDPDAELQRWPTVMYRKVKPSAKRPNGYEPRRVDDEAALNALGPAWKDTPEGMTPDVPFGHQE